MMADIPDEHIAWMRLALAEADKAAAIGDAPVGAVAVCDGAIIGRGYNRKEYDGDPVAHAEMFALREAASALGGWRLVGVTLYCTLEPCPMCAGAMVNARLGRLVYGADDPKAGACRTLYRIPTDERLNHQVAVIGGVLDEPCAKLLSDFFGCRR